MGVINSFILLKLGKNRTFNYQSAFSKEKEQDNNLEDTNREHFTSKWKRHSKRNRKVKGTMPIRTLVLFLVLLLLVMYVLEKKFM